jgi:zinc protease
MHSMRPIVLGVMILMSTSNVFTADAPFEPTGSVLDPFLSEVHRTVLPNGLTLLVRPQPATGVVAINTWVKAGYFHEPDEVAGMAHLFEHMFFKGSEKFPGAEQISQELSRVGGQTNAGTIYDSTNYYFVIPKEGFERGIEIQADAIMNPLFDPEELKKEAEVVIEESNRKLDNPGPVSMERMFATAFEQHRMRRWRIGSNEVLRNIDRDHLLAFFEELYRPENIIVTITGDVDPEHAKEIVAGTFGELPRGELKKERGPVEPPQETFRYGHSSADIQQGYSVFGWHTTGVGHEDEIALDVLAGILGSGRSSRMYRNVVGPDAASSANAFNWAVEDIGIFIIQSSFNEANRTEVDRRILREVERIRRFGPTDYELQLAKNSEESGFILGLQTVLGQAQALAYAEANYGYREIGNRLVKINSLTPEKIREVALKYLHNDNLTLYHYRPNRAPAMTREHALELVTAATTGEELVAETAVPLPKPHAPVRGASSIGQPHQMALSNGVTLVVQERPGAPIISTGVYFRGGRIGETSRNAGITQLLTRVMRRGTETRSAEELNREIEFLGTQIGTTVRNDYFGFELTILGRNFRPGLDLLADVLLHPNFPDEGIVEEKHLQLASIKRSFDSSSQRPFQLLYGTFFGNHPYALPADGYSSSVGTIERDDLVEWWRTWVTAGDALVVVVGDISAEEARGLAESYFRKLPEPAAKKPPVPEVVVPASRMQTVEYRDRKQSAIAVAYPAVPMDHENWPKLRLLQNITSGLAGTFFAELRGRRSLAYTVFAGESSRRDAGVFIGYLASDASKEPEAKKALIEQFKRLDDDGFDEEDLERAKAYFAGSTRIGRQTSSAHVDHLSEAWMYGLPLEFRETLIDRIQAIDLDSMREVAGKYLDGDNYTMAVLSGAVEE